MTTLHLNRSVTDEPSTVVLEDWYDELADDSLDPANILEQEETEAELLDLDVNVKQSLKSIEETTMSTTTIASNNTFNLNAWLSTARTLDSVEPIKSTTVPTPAWLTLKSGLCTADNAFIVTAGVVKSTRQVLDALMYTERQYERTVEELHMQEQRGARQVLGVNDLHFGPEMTKLGIQLATTKVASDHPGFNPDGVEHEEAVLALAEECEKLEAVIENGKRILNDIVTWVTEYAEQLDLKVQVGHTVRLGIIGNEIRSPKYLPLDPNTLLLAIEQQREFIRTARR